MRRHHVHDPWCGCPPDGWDGPSIGEPDWFEAPDGPDLHRPARVPADASLADELARLQARVRELETALAERSGAERARRATDERVPSRR
jgi:hypothetical protein